MLFTQQFKRKSQPLLGHNLCRNIAVSSKKELRKKRMYVPISGCKCASVCQKFLMPRRVQPCRRLGSALLCSALTLSRLLMFSQRFVLATKSPRSCCLWLQASLRLCAAETEPLANTNSARATRHVKTEGKNNRKKTQKKPRPSSHVEALCTHVCKHLKSFSGGLSTSPH